jgi:hypothetical protein
MKINFISSNDTALVKNLITGDSYPNVTNVSSFSHEGEGIVWLAEIIKLHASQGHALLTGELDRPLIDESRAGHVVVQDVQYLVLDVDTNTLPFCSREGFLNALGIKGSYIFQHSASSTEENSLRGHYMIPLKEETAPAKIKAWLKHINVTILNNELELSKSKASIKWPLDIVVNDSGRIIYIAPPIQTEDKIAERIVIKIRSGEDFSLPEEIPEVSVQAEINRLRDVVELPNLAPSTEGEIIKLNPDEVKITGFKEDRGFGYININDGDSWGYFFNLSSPDIVNNFKDEPRFYLKDLDPVLHAKYSPVTPSGGAMLNLTTTGQVNTLNVIKPIVFRDPESDVFHQVLYDPATNEVLKAYVTPSRTRLNDFMTTNGEAKPKEIRDGLVEFNPMSNIEFDPSSLYYNLFTPTPYLKVTGHNSRCPPVIEKLIKHLMVDQECYDHFMNWIAYIFQYRQKSGTAWLLHGTTETGKGTLFEMILQPIFGKQTHTCNVENALEQYNEHMRHNLIMFVDEFDINDINTGSKAWNKLKNNITEKTLTIRGMRRNQSQALSYSNYIFTTNKDTPIKIEDDERRLNIPPRQTEKLEGLADFRESILDELEDFSRFLKSYAVNVAQAHKALKNESRATMIENSRTSHEQFFYSLYKGDLEFFIDYTEAQPPMYNLVNYNKFEDVIIKWTALSKKTGPHQLLKDDVYTLYQYIIEPTKPVSPIKFTSICKNNNINFVGKRVHSEKRQYEYQTTLQNSDLVIETKRPNNVVQIK